MPASAPPFIPVFGTGAPGAAVSPSSLYYDASTNPFTPYVFHAGAWHQYAAGGGGANATSIQGIAVSATPPTDGQVLQYVSANGDYEPVPGSGGSAWAARIGTAAPSADTGRAFSCKGLIVIPLVDVDVDGLGAEVTTVAGATYVLSIYAVDGTPAITAIIADSAPIVTASAASQMLYADFAMPVTLSAGTRYAFCLRRTDAGDTYALPIFAIVNNTTAAILSFPYLAFAATQNLFGVLAKAVPSIGDVFSAFNGAASVGIKYRLP